MSRQEIKRLKAIKRKHDAVMETARIKRNVRLLDRKARREQAAINRAKPRLRKGIHLRNRELVRLAVDGPEGFPERRKLAMQAAGINGPALVAILKSRPQLEAKVKALLGVEELTVE